MDYFLADDLSGALDAAAAFHHAGRRVRISLEPRLPEAGMDDEVVAITTETRNAPPDLAMETVRSVLMDAQRRGARLLYKKIDSTLRGPVTAELSAVLDVAPGLHVLFTPANPAVGRTVRQGTLRVHGVPVAETDFARDPANPVRESSIWKLLGPLVNERVHVADAERQRDLDSAVAEMDVLSQPWVGVGSGALARAVAARMGTSPESARVNWPQLASAKVLMACGSAHGVNRAQAEYLWRERDVPVHEVAITGGTRDGCAGLAGKEGATLMIEAARSDSAAALAAITTAAQETITDCAVQRVFVTGGETAFALCGALGISTLTYLEEIEAGVCVASADTKRGPLLLAVKPGGFGDAGTWVRVWDRLRAAGS